MLRFRPIAPKPTTGSSTSSDPSPKKVTRGRPKRKYSKSNKNNNAKSETKEYELLDHTTTTTTTLQLFPNVIVGSGQEEVQQSDPTVERIPIFMNNRSTVGSYFSSHQYDPMVKKCIVTVESVTDMCTIRGNELGNTDEERVRNLELDVCPGFVSDGHNNVRWINPVFSQMTQNNGSLVTLAMRAKLPMEYPAFACVVRMHMPGPTSLRVLPCDVWRMDFGGLAWRLDLGAALSLGR